MRAELSRLTDRLCIHFKMCIGNMFFFVTSQRFFYSIRKTRSCGHNYEKAWLRARYKPAAMKTARCVYLLTSFFRESWYIYFPDFSYLVFKTHLHIHIPPQYILYGRENPCATHTQVRLHYAQWLSSPASVRGKLYRRDRVAKVNVKSKPGHAYFSGWLEYACACRRRPRSARARSRLH